MGNSPDIPKEPASQFTTQWPKILPFLFAGAGIILIVSALGVNYYTSKQNTSNQKLGTVQGTLAGQKMVKVDIEGAVQKPGVYEIPNDYRIQDVLITAGGLTVKANRKYLSENINLAQKVSDGLKIWIPETGEAKSKK